MKPVYHIKQDGDEWVIIRAGASRVTRREPSYKAAFDWAKTRARIIYSYDGTGRVREQKQIE